MTQFDYNHRALFFGLCVLALVSPLFAIPKEKATNETAPAGEEEAEVETEKPKPVLTGIPQIDYIHDPNLPRELNGFDLSDYPFYQRPPKDGYNFTCDDRHDGFYASIPHECQVYHNCLYGVRYDFLCPNFTAFDQTNFICHFANQVDCKNSELYFDRNLALYKETPTTTTTTVAPKVKVVYIERPAPLARPSPNRRRPGKKGGRPRKRTTTASPDDYYYYDYEDEKGGKTPADTANKVDDYYYYDEIPEATTTTTTTTTTKRPLHVRRPNLDLKRRREGAGTNRRRRPGSSGGGQRQPGQKRKRRRRKKTTTTTTTTPAPEYYDDYEYYYYDDEEPSTTTTTAKPLQRLRRPGERQGQRGEERRKTAREPSQPRLSRRKNATPSDVEAKKPSPVPVDEKPQDLIAEYDYETLPEKTVSSRRGGPDSPAGFGERGNRKKSRTVEA